MMRTAAQPALFGTDYHIARGWMLTPRGFSETAYGTLFAVGAVAALRWPNGWMFSAGCLLLTAILSRRAETFLILAAMMAAAGWSYFWRHDRARMIKPILAAGCAVIAFAIAHNGHNIRYFSSLWRSAEHRVEMLDEAVATARKLTEQSDKPASFDESAIDPKTVESLGSYAAQSGTGRKYPHNLFLESYIEVGAASAVLFGLIVAFPLTVGTHGTLTGRISYPAFLAIGICATVSLIAIKSGDLTGFGRVAFFAAVAVLATMPPVLQVKRSEHA